MDQRIQELPSARSAYAILGLSLCLMASVSVIMQFIFGLIASLLSSNGFAFADKSWFTILESTLAVYLFALPSGILTLRLLPAEKIQGSGSRLGFKKFLFFLPVIFCFMYSGSILGTMLSSILSNGTATNSVQDLVSDTSLPEVIAMVIIAPIMEELTFRKVFIDRLVRYGEGAAILFSAAAFGLFHMNFYQMFYAFGVGLVFGYIYVRTRRIQYTMVFHMIVNFFGGVVSSQILKVPTDTAWGVFVYLIFFSVIVGLFVSGLILFIKNIKKVRFAPAAVPMEKGTKFRTMFLHVGTIGFVVLCMLLCILALIV